MIGPLKEGTQLSFERQVRLSVLQTMYYVPTNGRALYQVSDASDGLRYALKVFELSSQQTLDDVRREVIALNRQNQHPERLPRVRSVEFSDGRVWVLMDWMDGTPLDDVTRYTPATTREDLQLRLAIARETCATAALIHDCRTVHRDLKPQNVLLKDRSKPAAGAIVIDFGLAAQPRDSYIEGTVGYAAPEQQRFRHLNLKPQTDVFALGQILCFLMLGEPIGLVHADGFNAWQNDPGAHVRERSAVALPQDLIALIAECLAFSPERRPPHARAVHNRLRSIERSGS